MWRDCQQNRYWPQERHDVKINPPILLLSLKFQNCFSKRREGRFLTTPFSHLGFSDRWEVTVFCFQTYVYAAFMPQQHSLLNLYCFVARHWFSALENVCFGRYSIWNKKVLFHLLYACHKQSLSSAMISAKFSGGKKFVALRSSLSTSLWCVKSCQSTPFLRGSKHALLTLKTAFFNVSSN